MMSPPIASNTIDAATLAGELARLRVIAPERLTDLLAEFPGGGPTALAEFLLARGELTPFQADRALAGEVRRLALGPYRLLGPDRPGILGPLFRAEKEGKPFSVRVLPLRSLWQAKQAKRFVRTLAAIPAHPAVVPLADVDSANGLHYLVWPVAEGERLVELVRGAGPFLAAEAAAMLTRLAAGLAVYHARKIPHGLLSPEAVLLGPDNAPRLLELGAGTLLASNLAAAESLFDSFATSLAVAGVLDYAAPEWIADPTRPTEAADQFALGAVGYFTLTGQAPPRSRLASVADVNPSVPPELAMVIDRLLQPEPADRFSSMEEVRELLGELAGIAPASELMEEQPGSRSAPGEPDPARQTGMAGWKSAARGTTNPEDSDASIGFDLPEAVSPEEPAAPTGDPPDQADAVPLLLGDTLQLAAITPSQSQAAFARGESPDNEWYPPQSTPNDANELFAGASRLAPLDTSESADLPPILPAVPLLPTSHLDDSATKSHTVTAPEPTELPPTESVLWKSVKKKFLFWQTPADVVHIGVFGPSATALGQSPRLTVFLYPPSSAESVGTLARAFQHEAVLLGSRAVGVEVVRGAQLAVHLGIAHIAVTRPLNTFVWRGNPHRLAFDLVIPWEAPVGLVSGVLSVGKDDVRIGKVQFQLPILDGS